MNFDRVPFRSFLCNFTILPPVSRLYFKNLNEFLDTYERKKIISSMVHLWASWCCSLNQMVTIFANCWQTRMLSDQPIIFGNELTMKLFWNDTSCLPVNIRVFLKSVNAEIYFQRCKKGHIKDMFLKETFFVFWAWAAVYLNLYAAYIIKIHYRHHFLSGILKAFIIYKISEDFQWF